jgi:BirA family biotin operon repressor/biotin-[acetyl-CoA-carboxylase] ligase
MSIERRAPGVESLSAEDLSRDLGTRVIGRRMLVYPEVASTNAIASELGEQGEPEGTVVIAEAQTAGRGRAGRRWASAPHVGLYTSILLRPRGAPGEVALLSQLAAVSLAEAVAEVDPGLSARIKWPNDLLVGEKKAAGILVETKTEGERVLYAVVGIGVNVNHGVGDFPEELRGSATSLNLASGRPVSRRRVAQVLYRRLDEWYFRFVGGERPLILDRVHALSGTVGRRVRVESGKETFEAFAERINADGSLRVRLRGGEVRDLGSADVSIR